MPQVASQLAPLYRQVQAAAPGARVIVVPYPVFFSDDWHCPALMSGISVKEQQWLRSVIQDFDDRGELHAGQPCLFLCVVRCVGSPVRASARRAGCPARCCGRRSRRLRCRRSGPCSRTRPACRAGPSRSAAHRDREATRPWSHRRVSCPQVDAAIAQRPSRSVRRVTRAARPAHHRTVTSRARRARADGPPRRGRATASVRVGCRSNGLRRRAPAWRSRRGAQPLHPSPCARAARSR